jgi:hypothetical protein
MNSKYTRVSLLLLTAVVLGAVAVHADGSEFKPLFDGKSLKGWTGDPELWKVENGVIIGSTDNKKVSQNSFLATDKTYKDFDLKAQFKLRNGNSGIQFRSKLHDGYRVTGYQADIDDNGYMGILYEEGGRGILANAKALEVAAHFKKDDWNEYVLTVQNSNIKQELNGYVTVEYQEQEGNGTTEGIIALQLHGGPPMEVRFKDIAIRELAPR